jgi:hypothetical protein
VAPEASGAVVDHPYTMRLSLSVLDHLGLNLYSNIPAVLSEIVANAWDADATKVEIQLNRQGKEVIVTDDGTGMTADDLNQRFLLVGYRRRESQPTETPSKRHVMGRKGIGKLSLFAIAKTIRVETARNGERAGLVLSADEIQRHVSSLEGDYHPMPLQQSDVSVAAGTRIVLSDLRTSLTEGTATALRRRLARRFSIIGPQYDFQVSVDGEEVKVTDRDYYSKIEYLWTLGGDEGGYGVLCTNATKTTQLTGVVDEARGWTVTGWVGTVDEQKSIDEETNVIPVLAWGKLIHEDLLSSVNTPGLYARYLMGEIHADFVDDDKADDIATSDRQSIKETDDRFAALVQYLSTVVLPQVSSAWSDWRRENALAKARLNPVVEEWYSSLGPDDQRYAKDLFGKIGRMTLDSEADRRELYKHGILAFEKLRMANLLSEIALLDSKTQLDQIGRVFANIDELEATQYGEIAKSRMAVIRSFVGLVNADEREKVIQEHLFDHLWLLNTSWERAATNQRVEERVTQEFAKIDAGLSADEKQGRVDIRYKTAAGKNIIIELKRYSVRVGTSDIVRQTGKYRRALQKCLQNQFPEEPQAIECIVVVGAPPNDLPPEEVERTLAGMNTRIVTYDTLISDALRDYGDYLQKTVQVSKLADLISRLDNPTDEGESGQPR